jgi:hypothetical protein
MNVVEAAINKHRLALLAMDNIKGWGPDYDAAVKAAFEALQQLVGAPCGSDPVFFQKIEYLDDYISTLDQLDDEFCCVTDAVAAYLAEREIREAA